MAATIFLGRLFQWNSGCWKRDRGVRDDPCARAPRTSIHPIRLAVAENDVLGACAQLGPPRTPLRKHLTAALPAEWRVLARRGWAGENSGLFEQPEDGNYSIDPRSAFRRPCFFLLSIRLFCEPFVGFVAFRFLRGIATL
jgi:hypothetical protein